MSAPDTIKSLVERFERNHEQYRSGKYNETQLRREFLDPFFEALGWDIFNKQGYAETYKDVIHEDSLEVEGATKAPDYAFRVGGQRKFFVEAKKPSVNIEQNIYPAFQLRRYAWSAKLPLGILSDFEEFAVYDCRVKPDKADKASVGRVMLLSFKDYVEKWDELVAIFSQDAVLKGSFDSYAEGMKGKKGTTEVDDAFLSEIEHWRKSLAENFADRNESLTKRELNYVVQMTIDRIIFLRICEDRGIERDEQLKEIGSGHEIYKGLVQLFQKADARYNSGLFHFKDEKEQSSAADNLTLRLNLDDKVLRDILLNLYYPDSPYVFKEIPSDILGQVYERFLGKVIRLTAKHHAIVDPKPEVRKAGGVYYTPTYIVNYIVQNTVGKLLEGKTPKDASKLRILDPACGSGTFPLGAYQYLLDWHLEWYINHEPEKIASGKNPAIFQSKDGWTLTTSKKKEILLNNIYGVDIDAQAVEVTKLSLLLKVLEGESQETIGSQLSLLQERVLPDLSKNIQCGNSLIGPDYYEGHQLTMEFADIDERYRVNAFDWNGVFSQIFIHGGFDAVIGNPPWGAEFSDDELSYLRKKHQRAISRTIDSYIYFIDKSFLVTKPESLVGFIVPSTIINQADTKPVRNVILERGLSHLISLGKDIFGKKVLNTSTIFVSSKDNNDSVVIEDLSQLSLTERKNLIGTSPSRSWKTWKDLVEQDPHQTFFVSDTNSSNILERIRKNHILLQDILQAEIQRGVSPDVASANVVSVNEMSNLDAELLRPSVSGSQIKRYQPWKIDQYIIYTTRSTDLKKYPKTAKRLEQYKDKNTCREVEDGKHPWYSLHRPRNPEIFASPKFIGLTTAKTIELIYDESNSIFVTDAMYVFNIKPEFNPLVCIAILSSKAFLFFYRIANQGESRVIPQVKATKLYGLPYPQLNNLNDKARQEKVISMVERMVKLHKQNPRTPQEQEMVKREIESTDRAIDKLVYELYGLSEDEIKIVEGKL